MPQVRHRGLPPTTSRSRCVVAIACLRSRSLAARSAARLASFSSAVGLASSALSSMRWVVMANSLSCT
eukprot:5392618-Alexandrium_andersonii.AAC.1